MIRTLPARIFATPTPIAGLALGIASLGVSWEIAEPTLKIMRYGFASIAGLLILLLVFKFMLKPRLLMEDLAHPVVGSVAPTFAMATMVISAALTPALPNTARTLWIVAVIIHFIFLFLFTLHRIKKWDFEDMVPSWFVPPIGIIVACTTLPDTDLQPLGQAIFIFGLINYAIMLPFMLYRLIFLPEVPDAKKPTLAILAAPASLCLAGYFGVYDTPNVLIVATLAGIAVLMTILIYLAFWRLLKLPFSPAYAAFTFPMVISATAMLKIEIWMKQIGAAETDILIIRSFANLELFIATIVVSYVAMRYLTAYTRNSK